MPKAVLSPVWPRDVDSDACAYVKRHERSHAGDDVI